MLNELPEDMAGVYATPAGNHLFTVNQEAAKLDEDASIMFHHHTAKLVFLCKRARPDIQTAVAFLTTQVKAPDVDNYKKLVRVMKYLHGTTRMALALEADDSQLLVKWWIDASFAAHLDMKGRMGGVMSLGKGGIYGTSIRQKIVTKSSTEAELVGVSDVLPHVIWTRNFLIAQGYNVRNSLVHQDSKSAILLEENGRGSSSKRTRHINIQYFFVTDWIAGKDVTVKYCPTGEYDLRLLHQATPGIITS
jgi:hypothetical protein